MNQFKIKNIPFKFILLLISLFVFMGCNTDETQTVVNFKNLVMADEFDTDGAPNPEMWIAVEGPALLGNGSQQYYTSRPENLKVEDGMLHITALKENFMGSGFTSARIETKGLYQKQYGRFEARIQMPWSKGLWPAFWMLGSDCEENDEFGAIGWPDCGEIDIVEVRGQQPTIVNGSIHGPGYCGYQVVCDEIAVTKEYDLVNDRVDTDFHIYGIEWTEAYINFYVDDVLYNQITPESDGVNGEWVFDNPFYMILNVAVGGGFVGPPDNTSVFPQTMLVDYVRVYQ